MREIIPLTIDRFDPRSDNVSNIGGGTLQRMAQVFRIENPTDIEGIRALIGVVGKSKVLTDNLDHVRRVMGDSADAVSTATQWVHESGLLLPVKRSLMNPNLSFMNPEDIQNEPLTVLIMGGVRNWMQRRVQLALEMNASRVLLIGSNRVMEVQEGEGVHEGMTESDYFQDIVTLQFNERGVDDVLIVRPDVPKGGDVATAGVEFLDPEGRLLIVSNAGVWVQQAGQVRRAMQAKNPSFDKDGAQLFVASDTIELGQGSQDDARNGLQNPLTAIALIPRAALAFAQQGARLS